LYRDEFYCNDKKYLDFIQKIQVSSLQVLIKSVYFCRKVTEQKNGTKKGKFRPMEHRYQFAKKKLFGTDQIFILFCILNYIIYE